MEIAECGPADIFAKRAREWVAERTKPVPADHAAQRAARFVRRWDDNETGLRMLLLGIDQITAKEGESELDRLERQFWNDDGGRNGEPDTKRSRDQRLADAMVQLLTGTRRTGDVAPHPKHNVTVTLDIAGLTTNNGQPLASLVHDGQPLPVEVLDRLLCNATITPILFDGPGRPIWVGRDHRTATLAQWRALIVRDRGCVGCGASPDRCEAHHITYWEHQGTTDIDNLVLVCTRCHHDIHDRGHTLALEGGRWIIRPPGAPPPTNTVTNFPTRDFPTGPDEPHLTLTA